MKPILNLSKIFVLSLLICFSAANAQLPTKNVVGKVLFMLRTEKGANAFNSQFSVNATGRNDMNAYLLSYLATAVYADKILELESPATRPALLAAAGDQLQLDSRAFVEKFKKVLSPYFSTSTEYTGANMEFFEPTSNFDGYDPEAMIIPTDNAIYVTVRGTDRVAQNNNMGSISYNVREWIQTDFQPFLFNPTLPGKRNFVGQVHQGMWLSISKIADRMGRRIVELGGANKKVWITGHSLGAGQAQLFAYYLAKVYNIKAQGVYGFAPPLVGNKAFYNDLETVLGGKSKLQRFEFMDDPITGFALNLPAYATGGTRVHYDLLTREIFDAPERSDGEVLRMSLSVGGMAANLTPLGSLGGMCYHTQNWYMQAALKQLTVAEAAKVPVCLPVPDRTFLSCESGADINRAISENQVGEGVLDIADGLLEAVKNAIESNISQLTALIKNFAGSALKNGEGKYRIKCLKGGRYLNVDGNCYRNNNCQVILWGTTASGDNETFSLNKYANGSLGYAIKVMAPNTSKVLDVKDMSTANNAAIQTYDKHGLPVIPNNQVWYFHQIGSTNQYVIQNERSGKVLEADNNNTSNAGCSVRQKTFSKGARNQIWVLERVN